MAKPKGVLSPCSSWPQAVARQQQGQEPARKAGTSMGFAKNRARYKIGRKIAKHTRSANSISKCVRSANSATFCCLFCRIGKTLP